MPFYRVLGITLVGLMMGVALFAAYCGDFGGAKMMTLFSVFALVIWFIIEMIIHYDP